MNGHDIVGGVVSTTFTENTGQEAELPALSVAEQITSVAPRLKDEPEGREQDEARIPVLSTAAKVHVATAVGAFPSIGVILNGLVALKGGQVNVGAVLSTFVILNTQEDILSALSVTKQLTYVVPRPNRTGLLALQD